MNRATCEYCGEGFVVVSDAVRHLRDAHGPNIYANHGSATPKRDPVATRLLRLVEDAENRKGMSTGDDYVRVHAHQLRWLLREAGFEA
jgi:hypothetical protein